MRETLLTINVVYFLFGATIYCGVMWSLRFFFYPSWSKMTVDNVQDHFSRRSTHHPDVGRDAVLPRRRADHVLLGHCHGDHRMG